MATVNYYGTGDFVEECKYVGNVPTILPCTQTLIFSVYGPYAPFVTPFINKPILAAERDAYKEWIEQADSTVGTTGLLVCNLDEWGIAEKALRLKLKERPQEDMRMVVVRVDFSKFCLLVSCRSTFEDEECYEGPLYGFGTGGSGPIDLTFNFSHEGITGSLNISGTPNVDLRATISGATGYGSSVALSCGFTAPWCEGTTICKGTIPGPSGVESGCGFCANSLGISVCINNSINCALEPI